MNRVFLDGKRKLCRAAMGALWLAALSGCVTVSDVSGPEAVSPGGALVARAGAVAGDAALVEEPMPGEWWTLFGDAALSALQAEAAAGNLDILAAAERVEESRARLGLAEAARRPAVAGEAGVSRSALSKRSPMAMLGAPTEPIDFWSLGLRASWELDFWGYWRQRAESAGAGLQASAFGVAAARVSVAGEVARVYLLLRGVQAQEAIAGENRGIAADLLRLAESRERNGVATRFDAAAARADLAGIEARIVQLGQQREALMNALAMLLGRAPRELDSRLAAGDLPAMPRRLPIGLPSDLARRRPDILQAEARLRAAVADIGAARADFYPRVRLTGSFGAQAFEFSDLGFWSSRFFSLGPALHLPIFQGGRLESQLALSEARHRIAALDWRRAVLRAWHEVDDALSAYAAEGKRRERLQAALAQNETALAVATRGYREGAADFTAVLVARRSRLASQAALADCATAAALSVVSLYRALGGGWSPELLAASTPGEDGA